jgi:hypothetical protein
MNTRVHLDQEPDRPESDPLAFWPLARRLPLCRPEAALALT